MLEVSGHCLLREPRAISPLGSVCAYYKLKDLLNPVGNAFRSSPNQFCSPFGNSAAARRLVPSSAVRHLNF
jgi:hypothetical protein